MFLMQASIDNALLLHLRLLVLINSAYSMYLYAAIRFMDFAFGPKPF